jgi:flagellin
MVINHNLSAMFADRLLSLRETALTQNIQELASGQRINSAADDASGLAVSEKMRGQIRGLNQSVRNIQNAVTFIQTTEGYLSETQDILHRMRELSVQAANGLFTAEDRVQIQVEISQLVDEVNRIASHAQFNGMNMLTGRFAAATTGGQGNPVFIQVGANVDQRERIFIGTMTAQALGLIGGQQGSAEQVSISTPDQANRAIETLDDALRRVSKQRADLGAFQNRFELAAEGVAIAAENLQAAESQIRDADIAGAMLDFVKNQILVQAGTAMLAQANLRPQSVLSLFG